MPIIPFVVEPIKSCAKKQTTLQMLEKISMNLDLLENIRKVYQNSFDTYRSGTSFVPDPMPHRIKEAWFAVKNKWFSNEERKAVKLFPHTKKSHRPLVDEIPKTCRNITNQAPRKIVKWGGGGLIFIYSCSQTLRQWI